MERNLWHLQEAVIKAIPKKKKYKNVKWFSAEVLQIARKRREEKGKEEKKRYTHLNAEFQRIARRDKQAFLSDQCKEIEGKNRMGKTRVLFRKIRDTKGIFHAKMGTLSASWEICRLVKKQQLEPDMEQWTGSKSGKAYVTVVYCQPTYLTFMQSTSGEMPGWMKYKLDSRLLEEISIASNMQMISYLPLWKKAKRN